MIDQQHFRQIVAERLNVSVNDVTDDADLIVDLGGDSLALAELTADLERSLEIKIPADRLYDLETVGDVWAAVQASAQVSQDRD